MREQSVENYLRDQVKALGGRCVKLVPLGWVGIPDRLAILPRGIVVFIEMKRPKGGRLSTMQKLWHDWLAEEGHRVEVLWSRDDVDGFLARIKEEIDR